MPRSIDILHLRPEDRSAWKGLWKAYLLASLSMLRATALEGLGRGSEAQRSRLEAYAWGRYGFADRSLMQIRLGEIANFAPNATQAARN